MSNAAVNHDKVHDAAVGASEAAGLPAFLLGLRASLAKGPVVARRAFAYMEAVQVIAIEGMGFLGLGAVDFAAQERFARAVGDVFQARESVPARYTAVLERGAERLAARLRDGAIRKALICIGFSAADSRAAENCR